MLVFHDLENPIGVSIECARMGVGRDKRFVCKGLVSQICIIRSHVLVVFLDFELWEL